MNKMGGVICDECAVVIYPKQNDTYKNTFVRSVT